MGWKFIPPTVGDRFERWVVVGRPIRKGKRLFCSCRCDCGVERDVYLQNLTGGKSQSCGCLQREATVAASTKHGCTPRGGRTRLYRIWAAMITRCTNPNAPQFRLYGGRGITVCPEWAESFEAFRDWAESAGYRDDLTIDRKDGKLGYFPDNCRWATACQQRRNQDDRNTFLEAFGERKTLADWAEDPRCTVGVRALRMRIKRRWDAAEAIAHPRTSRWTHKRKLN